MSPVITLSYSLPIGVMGALASVCNFQSAFLLSRPSLPYVSERTTPATRNLEVSIRREALMPLTIEV